MERTAESEATHGEPVEGVRVAVGAAGEHSNVQYFEIDPGATVPEHSHHHEQVGHVVQGEMTFVVDGEKVVCEAGDSYAIPSDEPHAARNDGEETIVGVETFAPPRERPNWADDAGGD